MKSTMTSILRLAAIVGSLATAKAATIVYSVSLDASQEPNGVVSTATGVGTVTLDDVTGAVTISGSYVGLSSTINGSHLHGLAPAGTNAGVIIGLSNSGGTSGTFSGNGILNPTQVTGMKDGLTYLNLHSINFGGGEIRGQVLTVVPEPGTALLGGLGILALGLRRRTS